MIQDRDAAYHAIRKLIEEGRYLETIDVPGAQLADYDLRMAARKGIFSESLIKAIFNRDLVKLQEEEDKFTLREVSSALSKEWSRVQRNLHAGSALDGSLKKVWQSYPAIERAKVLIQVKDLTSYRHEVESTLSGKGISQAVKDRFWEVHRPHGPDDPLYELAPPTVQLDIWLSCVFPSLAIFAQVAELRSRAKSITESQWTVIARRAMQAPARSDQIFAEVPIEIRIRCFASFENLDGFKDVVTHTMRNGEISRVDKAVLADFWRLHRPSDERDFLYPLAPPDLRREIWFTRVLPKMPFHDQLTAITKMAGKIQPAEWHLIAERLAVDLSFTEAVNGFLTLMPTHAKVRYFAFMRTMHLCTAMVIDVISQAQSSGDALSQEATALFWKKKPPTGPADPLFQYAPKAVQRDCCLKLYAGLMHQLKELFVFEDEVSGVVPARCEYDELTQDDRSLSNIWGEGRWNAEAQMLSARTAERVAAKFYKRLGHSVRDVSIEQLDRSAGNEWMTHDLLLDKACAVDVKNSRYPINSKSSYVDHTVPRFKRDRNNNDVLITAVISPYLRLESINHPQSAYCDIPPIIVLGSTSFPVIDALCHKFSTSTLEVRNPGERMIPAWLFDYPDEWYSSFDARCENLRTERNWPKEDELGLIYSEGDLRSIIPKMIAARIELPQSLHGLLDSWQLEFCASLKRIAKHRISLPELFLSLISHFLGQLASQSTSFSPSRYGELLYALEQRNDAAGPSRPLGVADPLGIVNGLCQSFEVLWQFRQSLKLERFHNFKLSGPGLLQGRFSFHSPWETILAYCGGWVYQKDDHGGWVRNEDGQHKKLGKCGNTPLILGREGLCPTCYKLICKACGFCSQSCEDAGVREGRLFIPKFPE